MVRENIKHADDEKKKKKLTEDELKAQLDKQNFFLKKKEKIEIKVETETSIQDLKELVKRWIISNEQAKKILDNEFLESDEIREMFEKIKQIEEIKNISRYIPKELLVNVEEYKKAVKDKSARKDVLDKYEQVLNIVANQINWTSMAWMSIFATFLHILDKNLIIIQENTIDLKESLIKINNNNKS